MDINIGDAISAIAGLGTAAFGLVDASKSLFGGVSNFGFGQIRQLVNSLAPDADAPDGSALSNKAIRATLRANWLNGTALGDQKSIAKTLFKMKLDTTTAAHLAGKTGVDAETLKGVAQKYADGTALTPAEQNCAARFDLLLSTLLDEAYQRGDQMYRNGAKISAVFVSIGLAIAGDYAMATDPATHRVPMGVAILIGALAAPLAPVSKDLASALQASVKTLQFFRK